MHARLIHRGTCSVNECASAVRRRTVRYDEDGAVTGVSARPRLFINGSRVFKTGRWSPDRAALRMPRVRAKHEVLVTPFSTILQCDSLLSVLHGTCQRVRTERLACAAVTFRFDSEKFSV